MFSDTKKQPETIYDKTFSGKKKNENNSMNNSEKTSQDPFSKAVMHIISKEYYKESQISETLRQTVEQCVTEWDELKKLQQIIIDRSEMNKIISQIANQMCSDMQVKSIQRNTPIFYYGDKDELIYYVLKGSVQLFIPKSQNEIWDEVDYNKKLKNNSINQHILEEKDNFDIVVNAIQKLKGSHIDLIKQNDKLRKKYFDENFQISKIKKIQIVKPRQIFGEISYLLEKPRAYTAIVSEELYCATFEPRVYRRALGEYFSFLNSKTIYLNNYFSSNIRKETLYHLTILFNSEIKLHLGDFLFKEGEEGNRIYLLKQGKIEFQRRMAAPSNLQKKKAELKSYQKTSVEMNHRKDFNSIQSLSQLPKDEQFVQDDNQKSNNITKKKKNVQIQPFTQGQLIDDETSYSNIKYKQKSTLTSMAGFDDIDQDTDYADNNKTKTNTNLDDFKYKNVSLGVIYQGEFFGFEDILISSSKNYSQNISQNRRTYSAKIISSDAIVISIERGVFLKMLSQNQILDQDVKTKALVKIQYHQQRIDSLKKFEDIKHFSMYPQKVPLKDMLKEKFLSIDRRPRPQINSMNNLKDMSVLKINLDSISHSEFQTNTISPNYKDIEQKIIQRNQNELIKNNSVTIKQEKKQGDDIDTYDEYEIPKDISKGNVQFLRFHDGQFADLKSMKQSYLDSEERIKQIKKSKHSVNISDENQLALERLFSKTNSPSIKNFQSLLLKKSSSIAKSAFQKNITQPNNNLDEKDTNRINEENEEKVENDVNMIQSTQRDRNNLESSPNSTQKKLKLILSKKQSQKQVENQNTVTLNQQNKHLNPFVEKVLLNGQKIKDQSKDIDLSKSYIKLHQITNENEKQDDQFRSMNVKHKESEYIANIDSSIITEQNNIKNSNVNRNNTEIQQNTQRSSINNEQRLSINILSENTKIEDSQSYQTEIYNIKSNQKDNEKVETELNQQEQKKVQFNQYIDEELNKSSSFYENDDAVHKDNNNSQKLNVHLTPPREDRDMNDLTRDSFESKQIFVRIQQIGLESGYNSENQNTNTENKPIKYYTEISEDQNYKSNIDNHDINTEFLNDKQETKSSTKVFSNKLLRRYKNSSQHPNIQFSSCITLGNDLNEGNTQIYEENIDTLRTNYQDSLVEFGQDNINHTDNDQKQYLQIDKNTNQRSKSLHNFDDPKKIESFSSLLPTLTNFDTDTQNTTTNIHKNRYKGDRMSHKPKIKVKSIDQKKQESQTTIYFNQHLQTYNNAQNIINELKQHLNDKTNSQDVSSYISMRNHSLPSLSQVNKKEFNSDNKKYTGQIQQSSKNVSPARSVIKSTNISTTKFESPSLQKTKDYHCKLRSFQLNFDQGNTITQNISPKLEPSLPDYKLLFSSKTTKRSDEYFKFLFSNPRSKYTII